jgi:hypothetical protein
MNRKIAILSLTATLLTAGLSFAADETKPAAKPEAKPAAATSAKAEKPAKKSAKKHAKKHAKKAAAKTADAPKSDTDKKAAPK